MDVTITKAKFSNVRNVDFDDLPFGKLFSDHMFVADYRDGEWQDLRIEPFHNFQMHPASMVFHYGQAIFEGMKATKLQDGTPALFRPELHAQRLNFSARRMCMPEFPEEFFLEAIQKLVELDQDWIPPKEGSALYIRPTMIATDQFIGVKPSQSYRFFIITGPVGPYYPKPVRLYAETKYVRAVRGGTGEAKAAGNYGGALLPAKIAQDKGFDQVLWLDSREFRFIQECGTMNVFFVIDDKVITPPLYGTILKGVTRDCAMQVLRDAGYDVEEYPLTIEEVVEAHKKGTLQEAFGAGTAAVVSHVSEISYKDHLMTLPPVSERKVADFVKSTLNGLRSGRIEDTRGWVVPVGRMAEVEAI
jgi:branched-chain amino acid aminotransferase